MLDLMDVVAFELQRFSALIAPGIDACESGGANHLVSCSSKPES